MSSSRPLEHTLLNPAAAALAAGAEGHGDVRLEILEAVASRVGGWRLEPYRHVAGGTYATSAATALALAVPVLEALRATRVPVPLGLASLARPVLSAHAQRKEGAYYTDFRLAAYLGRRLAPELPPGALVVDPASGTGILLVATVLQACGNDEVARAAMVAHTICAADLSADALRGARLALASLTSDLDAVRRLDGRLRVQDSLMVGRAGWDDVAADGFGAVVGNPPWEKLKVTRHEFLRAAGLDRHYGDEYGVDVSALGMRAERAKAAQYVAALSEQFPLAGPGEADLYKTFFELALRLSARGGRIAMLVPAGLIRSQGTERLRRQLFEREGTVDITVLENRARFFAIDTRFKFLLVHAGPARGPRPALTLRHAHGTDAGVAEFGAAAIDRSDLAALRPDLTVPEVRSDAEWRLFQRMSGAGVALGDPRSPWRPRIVREVDMTRDRVLFARSPAPSRIPLVEGRMVHQFRCGAKSYVGGTGRRAIWEANPVGHRRIDPQFWIARGDLPAAARGRCDLVRVGFCDVTGQTNERTILATRIPEGLACGNKVPTITFTGDYANHAAAGDLWLGLANSFAFDWLARRVVTTTVNFFLLLGLPFPHMGPDSPGGARIAALARELDELDDHGDVDPWLVAGRRANIDALAAVAYGLHGRDMELILRDFPLLDRKQPAIGGERTSTVTTDLVLARTAELLGEPAEHYLMRVKQAQVAGAQPYVPAQYAGEEG